MSGLKELRSRIEAVKSTQKITSAMKMIAASRLHRAQSLVQQNVFYSQHLETSVKRVMMALKHDEQTKNVKYILPPLLRKPLNPQKYLLFILSSDRGLCGSYNANIARKARLRINELLQQNKNIKVVCIGRKAYEIMLRSFDNKLDLRLEENFNDQSYADISTALADLVLQGYNRQDFDICEFIYARFNSALSRDIVCEKVCPLAAEDIAENNDLIISGNAFYEYLPDKLTLLNRVLPLWFANNIFRIIINSAASEHGARMTSMDSATRNAKKIVGELTLRYNSLRQSAITTELIEIIAGAEAV